MEQEIKELLEKRNLHDRGGAEYSVSRRAEVSDTIVDILLDVLGDDLLCKIAENPDRVVVLAPRTRPATEGEERPFCFYNDTKSPWCLGLRSGDDDFPIQTCQDCYYSEYAAEERAEINAEAAALKGATE